MSKKRTTSSGNEYELVHDGLGGDCLLCDARKADGDCSELCSGPMLGADCKEICNGGNERIDCPPDHSWRLLDKK